MPENLNLITQKAVREYSPASARNIAAQDIASMIAEAKKTVVGYTRKPAQSQAFEYPLNEMQVFRAVRKGEKTVGVIQELGGSEKSGLSLYTATGKVARGKGISGYKAYVSIRDNLAPRGGEEELLFGGGDVLGPLVPKKTALKAGGASEMATRSGSQMMKVLTKQNERSIAGQVAASITPAAPKGGQAAAVLLSIPAPKTSTRTATGASTSKRIPSINQIIGISAGISGNFGRQRPASKPSRAATSNLMFIGPRFSETPAQRVVGKTEMELVQNLRGLQMPSLVQIPRSVETPRQMQRTMELQMPGDAILLRDTPIPRQGQPVRQLTRQLQMSFLRIQPATVRAPPQNTPPPFSPTPIAPLGPFDSSSGLFGGKRQATSGRKYRYTPDISAAILGITSKKANVEGALTGYGIRPFVVGERKSPPSDDLAGLLGGKRRKRGIL